MIPNGGGSRPPYPNMQQQGFMQMQHQRMVMMQGQQMMPVQQMIPGQQMMSGQQMMPRQQMIPGQQMMTGQQMMPGQRFPGQQPVHNAQMTPGYNVPRPQAFPAQRPMPPPQYTPQMAQDFRSKHNQYQKQQQKYIVEQRKQMELNMKQQQFKDQQKRLLELSAIGGRKMDATSMIESIIGKSEPTHTHAGRNTTSVTHSQGQAVNNDNPGQMGDNTNNTQVQEPDDSFGDFMAGPAGSAAQQPTNQQPPTFMVPNAPANQQPPSIVVPNVSCNQQLPPVTQNVSTNQHQTAAVTVTAPTKPVIKEEKKDIVTMMFECSDLTAPHKAKGFVKKSVKEIEPAKKATTVYHASQTAHKWDANTEKLTELFALPTPEEVPAVPAPFSPPKWVTGGAPVPDVYTMVLEASTIDDLINTERLYPILLRSNLVRETLGQLWALCNKATPGQLIKEELYMLLAMISVAQNNMDCSSLDILVRCPQAPVPNLGQNTTPEQIPPTQPPTNQSQVSPAVPPGGSTHTAPTMSDATVNGAEPGKVDEDFAEFQIGPTSAAVPVHSASYGDCATVGPVTSSVPTIGLQPKSDPEFRSGAELMGMEDRYAAIQQLNTEVESKDEDIDEYFKNANAVSSPSDRPELTFKKSPKPRTYTSVKPQVITSRLETDFPVSSDQDTITTHTDSTMPDFESFAAFQHSQSESSSSQSHGWASNSSISGLTSASSNADDFADFASAGTGTPADDFNDFQQASEVSCPPDKAADKISALKALIMNKELYPEKTKLDSSGVVSDLTSVSDSREEEDWAAFSSNTADQTSSDNTLKTPSVMEDITPVAEPSAKMGFFTDSVNMPPHVSGQKEENWAMFDPAIRPGPDLTSAVGWESTQGHDTNVARIPGVNSTATNSNKRESTLKVDKAKSEKFFAKNIANTSAVFAVPAFSTFELGPPDLPEMKDDDDEFDEFGTFQGGNNKVEGISSLASGLDDLPDFGVISTKYSRLTSQNVTVTNTSSNSFDTTPTTGLEFSGWKSLTKTSQKEDSQSMNSLDFRLRKDESPSGLDSQSVSSLEFSAGDMSRKSTTPLDQRSIASLELRATSEVGSDDAAGTPDVPPGGTDNTSLGDSSGSLGMVLTTSHTHPSPHAQINTDWNFEDKPRNVSELLTHGDLPAVGDRYSELIHEPQDTDKHTYHWQKCLEKCKGVLIMAMETLQQVSKSDVAQEIISSDKGTQYLKGIVEVYRVSCRIKQAMRSFSISNSKLENHVESIEDTWASLTIFIANTHIMPERAALDFTKAELKANMENSQSRACGVCILNVDAKYRPSNIDNRHKLTYGGRQYHLSCANFWVNCVDSTLPSLPIPELL